MEMTETVKQSESYCVAAGRLKRESQRLGHKLSLAQSEQEDRELWERYWAVISEWRALEISAGHQDKLDAPFWNRKYFQPVFDENYISLTKRLAEMYQKRGSAVDHAEYRELNRQINELTSLRRKRAKYVPRDVGECQEQTP